MTQTSITYLFILLSISIFYNLFNNKIFRLNTLLLFSFILYGSFNLGFLILLFFIIIISYFGGKLIFIYRNTYLYFSILLILLLPLFFYKYFLVWFFSNSLNILPISALNFGGYGKVLIPVGLSFFTFQSIGYVIDIKDKKFNPEKNFIYFSLFISFFPQLLAGPIERYKNLMPQLKDLKSATPNNVLDGTLMLIYGFFLKLCLADRWGEYSDTIFEKTSDLSSLSALTGTYAFSIQLYGDFFGYTMIALGSAKLFGIKLSNNFKEPYFSKNINEFWQNWHISLTTWIFDYVYKGIGSRILKIKILNYKLKSYFTSLFTWLILGLWHGANFTFILFGIIQFLFIQFREIYVKYFSLKQNFFINLFSIFITFHCINFSFSLIRSASVREFYDLMISLISFDPGLKLPGEIKYYGVFILIVVLLIDIIKKYKIRINFFNKNESKLIYLVLLIIMIIFFNYDYNRAYIYFRF